MTASVRTSPVLQSLDGAAWKFRDARERASHPAIVPGCVHKDLLRVGKICDPFYGRNERELQWIEERDWIYAASFTVGDELQAHGHIDLVAEGLDTVAHVRLNGIELGRTENMFVTHRWPVKATLRRGVNRLEVEFLSPMAYVRSHRQGHAPREINDPVGGCTRIRKQQCSFGWDWGPRLATSGIWKSIYLQGWSENRLVSVRVRQRHLRGKVRLQLEPELASPAGADVCFHAELRLNNAIVAEADDLRLEVTEPQLWWPRGQGAQPLYDLKVECRSGDGAIIDVWSRRIGLRTIELDRRPDRWGERFQFCVNGRPIFAKGANWIPAHALTAGLTRDVYEPLLRAAADAHMNMLRVWGGGIYEDDAFYELCDELGLLVWQDFMFACTLYPGDPAFLRSVETEAEQQVRRLRHHACLALWCGNNEIESLNEEALRTSSKSRKDYAALFDRLLPAVMAEFDGVTAYWRSSPLGSQTEGLAKDAARLSGDWHDWDVWHARQPIKAYEKSHARFASEFGMQSFSSPAVAATYCAPAEWNIFSPVMEDHQKNPSGNAIILDYVSRRYRFPNSYEGLAYLSQLNQAYCMKVAVEHWRRSQPRTMGALYWQLNDCWPVASWSSLEFGGRWKPLHHAARRFFAPILVSAHVSGDENRGIGNWLHSNTGRVELYTVSDHPASVRAVLTWTLWHHSEGRVLRRQKLAVELQPRQSRRRLSLDFSAEIKRHGRNDLLLNVRLESEVAGLGVSEDVVLFTAPRHLELRREPIAVRARAGEAGIWLVEFSSTAYHHGVWFGLPDRTLAATDNGFDLLPGVPHRVEVSGISVDKAEELERLIVVKSLVDTYACPEMIENTPSRCG